MKLTNTALALIIVFTSLVIAAPPLPTATRPTPDKIIVVGADYATVSPWSEVYAVAHGIRIIDSMTWDDGTIEYYVNPTVDYIIQAFSPDDPETEEIDRVQVEIPMPVTTENRLDWILFNRIKWERELSELVASEGIDFFDMQRAMERIRDRLDEDNNQP